MIVFEASTRGGKYKMFVEKGDDGFFNVRETVNDRIQCSSCNHPTLESVAKWVKNAIHGAREWSKINYKISRDDLHLMWSESDCSSAD